MPATKANTRTWTSDFHVVDTCEQAMTMSLYVPTGFASLSVDGIRKPVRTRTLLPDNRDSCAAHFCPESLPLCHEGLVHMQALLGTSNVIRMRNVWIFRFRCKNGLNARAITSNISHKYIGGRRFSLRFIYLSFVYPAAKFLVACNSLECTYIFVNVMVQISWSQVLQRKRGE